MHYARANIIQRPPKVLDFGLGKFRWTAKDTIGNLEKMTQTELWKLADQNSDQRSVVTGPTWSEMGHITGSPLFSKPEISVSFHPLYRVVLYTVYSLFSYGWATSQLPYALQMGQCWPKNLPVIGVPVRCAPLDAMCHVIIGWHLITRPMIK